MKTYKCKICHHLTFDEPPVNCPVCMSPIENFGRDDDAIKMPSDRDCLNEFEKRHLPVLEIGKGKGDNAIDVNVRVGEVEHEMASEHYIEFIDFYIDKRYISRLVLTPKILHPATTIHLNSSHTWLTVISKCSEHGYWMAEKAIDILSI